MNWWNMRRIGGISALLQGGSYILFLLLVLVLLPLQGGIHVADYLDPANLLGKAAAYPQTVSSLVVLSLLYIGFGVFPFLMLLALVQTIPQATRNERLLVVGFVLINTTLSLAAAAINSGSLPSYVQLYQQHVQEAVTGYRVVGDIYLQLGNAAAAAYGMATIVLGVAALRGNALPRSFAWLSLVWGAIAILSWPFILIGAIGPIVGIIWSLWVGLLLWRIPSSAVSLPSKRNTEAAS